MQKLSKLILFLFISIFLYKPNPAYAICQPWVPSQCAKVRCEIGDVWNCCDASTECTAQGGIPMENNPSDQDEAFPGISFPCGEVYDPEFHSLRPYQAAVCGDANKALYCSNELKFIESFDLTGKCDLDGHTSDFDCNPGFNVNEHNLYVELTDSMFPIMGNTEQVKSYSGNEEFDDAQKVNEYASWYLSGVNNRAEYGENTDDKVVNFSGPIQKLLPKMIQEAERIKTINKAAVDGDGWTDDDGVSYTTPQNHNQIVVCGDSNLGWFGGLFNIGKITPVPCYGGDEKFRLIDGDDVQGWYGGDLSDFNGFFNIIGTDIWNKRTPPLPWDDGTVENPTEENPAKPFESQIKYQKAYSEWRGRSCATIPLIDINLCIDNPFVPNKWAELYQYIPLSNTTDKKGAERILDVMFKPSNGTEIANEKYDEANKKSAPLYFAHTQEVKELSELLNTTYLPKDYESEPLPETTEKNVCSAVNIRTNKGDNIFPGDRPSGEEMVIPGVTYDITQVLCKVTEKEIEIPCTPPKLGKCTTTIYTHHCNAEVILVVPTDVKVPNADEIFATTVADSGSTFRKIFPKVEEGAPVTCIADIPTVTSVTYNAEESEVPRGGSLEFKVKEIPEDSAGNNPELTFPHIGSVYEYFLKGIQTALRPKGYGEPIASGNCKTSEVLDGGDCSFDMDKVNKGITEASAKYNVPAELLRGVFELESLPYIADPSSYQCTTENSAGAIGIGQFKKESVDSLVTCEGERMENDIGMCGNYGKQLSRCNIEDSFELMARLLLLQAGKLNNCQATGSMSMANKEEWWSAACQYGEGFGPSISGANYQNAIPANERPVGRDMNYCDILCHRMGYCPSYPNLP